MQYKNIVDFHVHTDNSCDGHDSLMYMCEQAAKNGVRALAVTDHAECQRYYRDRFDKAIRNSYYSIRKSKASFYGQLTVLTGLELGQPLHDLKAAQDAVDAGKQDFIIASLHCVKGQNDFWNIDYQNCDVSGLLHAYFDELYQTVQWGQFDSLGHITYPLRYIVGREKISVDMNEYSQQIHAILKLLVEKGKALELNTQGLRTEYGKTIPDLELLKLFRSLGGEYVTIGSDAHRAKEVGMGIREGLAILQEAGYTNVTLYDGREPIPIPIK